VGGGGRPVSGICPVCHDALSVRQTRIQTDRQLQVCIKALLLYIMRL